MKVISSKLKKSLLIAFFQGEGNGFIGSRKFLEDIKHFKCEALYNNTDKVFCSNPMRVMQKIRNS